MIRERPTGYAKSSADSRTATTRERNETIRAATVRERCSGRPPVAAVFRTITGGQAASGTQSPNRVATARERKEPFRLPSVHLWLTASLLAVAVAGCERAAHPGADGTPVPRHGAVEADAYKPQIGRHGGQFVMASFGEGLKTFNPVTAGETSTTDYTARIFEGLLFMDPWTGEMKPWLAESWEHSEDYLVWTFHLRRDVKFNNGLPMTADDVVFSFNINYRPEIVTSTRDLLVVEGKQWEIEKVDDYTVRITLPTKYAIFEEVAGSGGVVPILSREVCEPAVEDGTFNSFMGAESTPDQIVGTGPFMLDNYVPGQRLTLTRNPHYWRFDAADQRLPYLDRLIVVWVQTIDGMMLRFKTGQTDTYGLRGADYPILKPLEERRGFKIYELGPHMGSSFLTFNQNPGSCPQTGRPYIEPHKVRWFRNTKFRQAMAMAVDRRELIRAVHNGLALPQYGPMNEGSGYFYNPDLIEWPYDLEKASQYLAEIGLKDRNGDGWLTDEEDRPVAFTILTNSGNDQREKTAEILRKDLAQLGIRVDLKFIEFNTLITQLDETFDWEAIVLSLTGSQEPYFGANVWKSSGRMHMWYPRQEQPSTEWEARIDAIFDEAIQEPDREKRKVLFDEWQTIVNEQQPFIYTTSPLVLAAFSDKFGNVFPTILAAAGRQACTWNIEELYIKEGYPLR